MDVFQNLPHKTPTTQVYYSYSQIFCFQWVKRFICLVCLMKHYAVCHHLVTCYVLCSLSCYKLQILTLLPKRFEIPSWSFSPFFYDNYSICFPFNSCKGSWI